MQFIAVLLDEFYHVARVDKYGGSIVARMDTHELVLEILVHVYHYVFILVGKDAERSDRTAGETHLLHEVFLGSECERTGVLSLSEFLEVDLFVLKTCDEIVFALFVIADKKVFRDLFRMRQIAFQHLIDSVYRFVLYQLIFDLVAVQQLYDVFFCKSHYRPCPFPLLFACERAEKVAAYCGADIASDGPSLLAQNSFADGLAYFSADSASGGSYDLTGA